MLRLNRIVFMTALTLVATYAPVLVAATEPADDDGEPASVGTSLLGDTDLGTGGYVAPVVKFGKEINGNSSFGGVQGAWQALPYLSIGAGAYALGGHVKSSDDPKNRDYDVVYGGLRLEVQPIRTDLVALQLAVLGGGGSIVAEHPGDEKDGEPKAPNGHFRVVEPEIEADFTVTDHLRVGVGVGYRFVRDVDFAGVTNHELSGASGLLALKIGSL